MPKYLHLLISAIIVILAGLVYGAVPSITLSYFFGFEIYDLEQKNIFRAIMGLYLAMGIYWIIGAVKTPYWRSATLCNIVFMGGLVFGRLISTIVDGISAQFIIGLILELIMVVWGIYNLKKYNTNNSYIGAFKE